MSVWPEPQRIRIYRCVWVLGGKIVKDNGGSHTRALQAMRMRLAQGFAAWIEEMPSLDDDIPF
tara:strand:+ start:598 stop:786 length:189 start_codon:yes stop_codon:yes gene_type:complete